MSHNNKGQNEAEWLRTYATVKQRKKLFEKDYPNGKILPITMSDVNYSHNYIMVGALLWKDADKANLTPEVLDKITDMCKSVTPTNAGLVLGAIAIMTKADSMGYSLSIAGGPKADKNAWVENCEESAIGRALDNAGYQSGTCSQDELKKVEHMNQVQQERTALENEINNMLMHLSLQNVNLLQLQQICIQSTRPFNQLMELSTEELYKVRDIVRNFAGQATAKIS